ncbi:MAG: Iron-binding zinc finger CDGSH type [Methanocella sp. PtaU1.Bin125]|nr:MAG: Iron-binding zinc finger CDGSH type [Methanocella sp. PtaU1.Bin125]
MTVTKDGPYLVTGGLPLAKEIIVYDENEGCPTEWAPGGQYPDKKAYALCRCGLSGDKPFCDGTHAKEGFDGTETAPRGGFMEQAETIGGKDIALLDVPPLCARARFCHQGRGIWQIAGSQKDAQGRARAEHIAGQCPAGRLVIWDKKTETPVEPHFEPAISLIEDPEKGVSGGIWVKGGVPVVGADGRPYEARNRVTLCRCGLSGNKPFCDGSHIGSGFTDGDASLTRTSGE